jgi:signal peptidase I
MDACGKRVSDNKQTVLSYLHDFVILLAIILLVFLLLGRIVVVSGPSMMNTLIDGDYLLVIGKPFYSTPQVGDVVVVSKDTFKSGEPIIKRVIAIEGQTVQIVENNVYVDGVLLNEAYISSQTNAPYGNQYSCVVADGCVFVMGDNRSVSKDSRSTEIGQIDCREIIGKAVFLFLPGVDEYTNKRDFSRIGGIS